MDIADIVTVGYVAYTEIDRTLKLSRESDTDADTTLAVVVGINNLAHAIIEMAASNVEVNVREILTDPKEEELEEPPEATQEDGEVEEFEDLSEEEKESIQALSDEIFRKRKRGRPKKR